MPTTRSLIRHPMIRSRSSRPRSHALLAVVLACAQLVSLVGFPIIVRSGSGIARCAGGACGCRNEADKNDQSCCCSTASRTITLEPKSCCSQPRASKSCCSKAQSKREIIWVVGVNAKGCKSKKSATGFVAEPSIPPPTVDSSFPFPEPTGRVCVRRDVPTVRPAFPPDPPPRFPVSFGV